MVRSENYLYLSLNSELSALIMIFVVLHVSDSFIIMRVILPEDLDQLHLATRVRNGRRLFVSRALSPVRAVREYELKRRRPVLRTLLATHPRCFVSS